MAGRSACSAACYESDSTRKDQPESLEQDVKPYDEMPGPRGPCGLGNIYKYLPLIGEYSWRALHTASYDKYVKFGSIVRETMVPGQDVVWIYDPKDIGILLSEREPPQRRSHLALGKYRSDRPHIYRSTGLIPTNGPDWHRLRKEVQKEFGVLSVRTFLPDINTVTREFMAYLPVGVGVDMLPKLTRLNLELTCLVTFGKRLDSFGSDEQQPESRSSRLMRAAEDTNSSILPTDQGFPLWHYFETFDYKRLRKAQEYMESIVLQFVTELMNTSQETSSRSRASARPCLIEAYLKNDKLDIKDVIGVAADLLLAGIDTTSYATAYLLYNISRHAEVQKRLYEEVAAAIPDLNSEISEEVLRSKIPFACAVLKESLRLHPVAIGTGRILSRDLVLGGYVVPKGTSVVTQNMVACRLPENFENPDSFIPDRWLEKGVSINPFLVLPFGHGMRACIARRLAEQYILVLLLHIIRRYELIWQGSASEITVMTLLINKPKEPVNVMLKPRVEAFTGRSRVNQN